MYSGDSSRAAQHFETIGHQCPPGYNIADYLIDVTVEAAGDHRVNKGKSNGHITPIRPGLDPENGFASRQRAAGHHDSDSDTDDASDVTPRTPNKTFVGEIRRKAHQILGAFTTTSSESGSTTPDTNSIPEKLANLVLACRASDDAKIVEAEIARIQSGQTPGGLEARDVGAETELLRGYKMATYWTQFKLLSGRAFKNLYRWVSTKVVKKHLLMDLGTHS